MKIKDNRNGVVKLDTLLNGDVFEFNEDLYLMIGVNEVYDFTSINKSMVFNLDTNKKEEFENSYNVIKLNAHIEID